MPAAILLAKVLLLSSLKEEATAIMEPNFHFAKQQQGF